MANKSPANSYFIKIAVTAALLGVVLLSSASSGYERLRSLSVDASLWIRSLYQPTNSTVSDQVVVISIDEQTYRTAPFSETPKVMWTPQIAEVQDAVLNSGANVFGYDIIFPTSVDSFIRGYESSFLQSVSRWSRAGKLVLGQAQHSTTPLAPHAAQLMVSGGKRNLRSLNLVTDLDEVTRRPALGVMVISGVRGKGRMAYPVD